MTSTSNRPENQPERRAAAAPVFLMSRPRDDWQIRGRANVFAQGVESPSAAEAQRDWDVVKDAIEDAGGHVLHMENNEQRLLTGLPYTAEAGVLGRNEDGPLFVLANPTPPHRQAEIPFIRVFLRDLGIDTVNEGGHGPRFEGQGDVIDVGVDGGPAFVCTWGTGPWARTERAAFDDELARFLPGPSIVINFHADPWFHGNTFLGAFKRGDDVVTVLCEDAVVAADRPALRQFLAGTTIVTISKEQSLTYATNALQVNETVLAPTGVPDVVVAAWKKLGLQVRFLDLPALFRKGGGAAVCLTNRLHGLTLDDIERSRARERVLRPRR